MQRFEIWLAQIPLLENSSVQNGLRPVIIVSNDLANKYSPVVTVIPLTSKAKKPMRTHVILFSEGLSSVSLALCENIMTVDKSNLIKHIGRIDNSFDQVAICRAIRIQLGMAS